MFNVNILTAYPDMFPGSLGYSILGKALNTKKWTLNIINLHDFGFDDRKSIDDQPFGGGPGMVIRPDVVEKALLSLDKNHPVKRKLIYLSPIIKLGSIDISFDCINLIQIDNSIKHKLI